MAQKVIKKGKSKKASRLSGRFITLAMAIIFVIACPFVYFSILSYRNKQAAESKMATYLSKKYQEDFVVEKPECKGGGIGIECSWKSKAHPVSNPETKFNVSCVFSDTSSPSSCSDQYIAALWSVQASKELQEIISQVNREFPDYKADSARAEIVLSGDLVDAVDKRSKYDEYKTNDKDIIHRILIESAKGESKPSYIFKVVEKLREKEIYYIELNVNKDRGVDQRCSLMFDKERSRSEEEIKRCID